MVDLLPLSTEAAATSSAASGRSANTHGHPPLDYGPNPADVLDAFRRYRSAEADIRRRARRRGALSDNDLSALRYLLSAQADRRSMGARDLSALLEISPASVSVMLDRLERNGFVTRSAHPTDRRASLVEATDAAAAEVTATIGALHERMLRVASSLEPAEVAAVHRFLTAMTAAVATDRPA